LALLLFYTELVFAYLDESLRDIQELSSVMWIACITEAWTAWNDFQRAWLARNLLFLYAHFALHPPRRKVARTISTRKGL